jgi:hypothetical protein
VLRRDARFEHLDLAFDRGGRGNGAGAALFRRADGGAAFSIRCRHFRRVKSGVQVVGSGLKCCSFRNCVSARFLEPLDPGL